MRKVLINSRNLLVESLGSSIYQIISPAIRYILNHFLFVSQLFLLSNYSKTTRTGGSGHPSLIDFSRNAWRFCFCFVSFSMILYVCHISTLLLKHVPSITSLFRTSVIKKNGIMSKAFTMPTKMTMWLLLLNPYVINLIYWFTYAGQCLNLWSEAKLIMINDLLMYYWILITRIFACIFIMEMIGL